MLVGLSKQQFPWCIGEAVTMELMSFVALFPNLTLGRWSWTKCPSALTIGHVARADGNGWAGKRQVQDHCTLGWFVATRILPV